MCSLNGRNIIPEGHGCSRKEKSCITPKKPLLHLSNMSSSFCDKVKVLKHKTECEGWSLEKAYIEWLVLNGQFKQI